MYFYRLISLSALIILAGCNGVGLIVLDNPGAGNHWQQKIDAGEWGLADFTKGELVNIDTWPRITDVLEASYTTGCTDFIKRQDAQFKINTKFKVRPDGKADSLYILSEPGACKKSVVGMIENARFLPGLKDGQPVPTITIFPFQFSFTTEE